MTDPVTKSAPATTAGLAPGLHRNRPTETFPFLIRFVNLVNCPPEGVRYEILVNKKSVAKCTVGATDNETAFEVADGAQITILIQAIGDTALRHLKTFSATPANPVALATIKSAKVASKTEPHRKNSSDKPQAVAAQEPAAGPAAKVRKDQGLANLPSNDPGGVAKHLLLPSECACGRELTIDELAAIFPTRSKADLTPYLDPINNMFSTYEIHTCLRKAHALAQIGHESGSLRDCAEKLPAGATEEKKYGGYKGRGLIQITGKEMYAKYGKYKGEDFLDEQRLKVETLEYAVDSAGWFWNFGKPYHLSEYADLNDLIFLSAVINSGFNGFDDRAQIFIQAHKTLHAQRCKEPKHRSSIYLPFEASKAYDNRDMAFAWGLWNDPLSDQKGLSKNIVKSKAGYDRFLALNKVKAAPRGRFGYSPEKMVAIAEERSK
jgi:putative chitinase